MRAIHVGNNGCLLSSSFPFRLSHSLSSDLAQLAAAVGTKTKNQIHFFLRRFSDRHRQRGKTTLSAAAAVEGGREGKEKRGKGGGREGNVLLLCVWIQTPHDDDDDDDDEDSDDDDDDDDDWNVMTCGGSLPPSPSRRCPFF